ncbi:MAG: DegT/DnrJ/EryC1/StrS family aminotransferase [Elusimicrobia bacterium]|nr:DegT/DnrJ/EryC1/StrS family aminotransferase [Elusimicrobiota bacterium]
MKKNKLFDPCRLDGTLDKLRPRGHAGSGEELARELAAFTGRRRCLLAGSGAKALRAALSALGPARVALPAVTHGSLLWAVREAGAEPVFLDVELSNLNLSRKALEKAAGTFDVLLNAHMFGASAGPEFLESLAKKKGFVLVDDASQIIGHSSGGRNYGSFGTIGVFSLSSGKPVSCPEKKAGALLWDDPALDKKLEKAARGEAPAGAHAAYLQLKLKVLPVILKGLRAANAVYREELSGLKELALPGVSAAAQEFPLLAAEKRELEAYLLERKVPLEQVNEPLLPEHAESGPPAARRYFREALHLPVYPAMSRPECLFITKAVKDFFGTQ